MHLVRKLTAAEQNYAQIQKEAHVFEVQKFRQYLMGHNLQLNDNDFHPNKDISEMTASHLQ